VWAVIFSDRTLKAQGTKTKIDKWDCIKLKSFFTAKEIIDGMKMQPMAWEKIFASHISDKRLVSKIYKELIQLTSKKQPDLKTGKGGTPGWLSR